MAIALDTATQSRLGTATELVRSAKIWINIDHHPSNPGYGDLVYIDSTAPATGQILFELIQSQGLPMDAAIAENLFVAISHRHRFLPISEHDRANFRDRRRTAALRRERRAASASSFTKATRAGARSCCASCSARCVSKGRKDRQLQLSA